MPKVGGRWASGLPYLDGAVKRADARAAGLWLELRQLQVEALKARSLRSAGLCMPCRWLQGAMLTRKHPEEHAHTCERCRLPCAAPAAVGCSMLTSTLTSLLTS